MRNFINLLAILVFILPLYAQEFSLPEGADEVEIPIDVVSGIMIARAKVNGTELRFIIDSGASRSTIFNINGVDSLNVGQGRETTIRGYGSLEPFKAIESSQNLIQIGELKSENATINVLTESQISFLPILGTEVNGIIGIEFFKNHLVELDFRRERILIYKDKSALRLSRYEKIKLEKVSEKLYINAQVKNDSSEMPARLLLDTGSGDALWLFEKDEQFKMPVKGFRDYLGFGMSGDVYGFRSKVDTLEIGDFTFDKITFAYPELDRENFQSSELNRGSIGGEVLRRFEIVIDYDNEFLYLRQTRAFKDGFYYNMAGLKLREGKEELVTDVKYNYDPDKATEARSMKKIEIGQTKTFFYRYAKKIIVSYVAPDSPADLNGIKEGDQVIGLFNKDLGEFSMGEVTYLFYRDPGSVVKLRMKRGEKYYEVRLKLKPIIE